MRGFYLGCTPLPLSEHSYHTESDRVLQDLVAVLSGQKPDSIASRTYVPYANKFRLV